MSLVENFLSSWIAFGLFILALLSILLAVLVMLLIIVLLRFSDTFALFVHGGCSGGRIRRFNWQSRFFSLLRWDLNFVPAGATRGLAALLLLLLLLLL